MCAYNAAPFINEAIDSLLTQSFHDFELWIVDDASEDNTANILSAYNDKRIKIYRNDTNLGRDAIVNQFVKKIETPFFTVTDADDVSHPFRLQKQIELLEADATLMMCGTSYYTMNDNGFIGKRIMLFDDHKKILENIKKHSQFHGPTTVMRKECIDRFTPFYRTNYFEAFADADLCSRIVSEFKAINISEALYFYRIVGDSMSRKDITPFGLNYYSLIYWLYLQRLQTKSDAIELGDFAKVKAYKEEVSNGYDQSSFYRHLAFTHLYWGLLNLSIKASWKSFVLKPFRIKNTFSLFYIIFRCGLFYLYQTVNRVHYLSLIQAALNKS
jgi:glycosyltransferase involved in cell wall biosynthesis